MKRLSIGLRLTLWYVAIFAVAQLVFGATMWFTLRHNRYDFMDDALHAQIEDLQRFFESQPADASLKRLRDELTETSVLEHAGDFLQVCDESGEILYRAALLEQLGVPSVRPGAFQHAFHEDRRLGGQPYRFVSENLIVHGHTYTVQTGLPAGEALEILDYFRRNLLLMAPLVLLVAAGVGYWLSHRALAPVDALTRTARQIGGQNLSSRVDSIHTGDELQRLSDTLNEMLARIEAAFLRVTQFTADASHELRTPVALMRTEAELALRKSRSEGEYRDALAHILRQAEGTSVLIDELLSLARKDSGRESLELLPVQLAPLLREAARDWQAVAADRHLHFIENLERPESIVLADARALTRVVHILLDNAFKYTPATGTVELFLERKDGSECIGIRDTGIGISEEDLPKIFERFYRADKARSRELGGAGLGLAIADWIIQQHHGSIRVESTLGQGSLFRIDLTQQDVSMAAIQSGK